MKIITKSLLIALISYPIFISSSLILGQSNDDVAVKITPVGSTTVRKIDLIKSTIVRGEIESLNIPFISAKIPGQIAKVLIDEGMIVSIGDNLAKIDDEAYLIIQQQAMAEVLKFTAFSENQSREVKRNKELFSKKLISQSVLDNVLTKMKQVEAELMGAKAHLREAAYKLRLTNIRSPINGIVQQRLISKGDYVKVAAKMFQLVSVTDLRARIYLPDMLDSLIQVGMTVELSNNHQQEVGKITHIRPKLENDTRALQAMVSFSNESQWKPGTTVNAKIVLSVHNQAVAVSVKSLVRRPNGIVLYQIQGNKVVERIVTTGIEQDNFVEITSGIKAGDTIVTDGAPFLTDGAIIEIQQSDAL